MQKDNVSVVELVTAFSIGKMDFPELLDALQQREGLDEDEYKAGMDTLWRMREEQAIDQVSITTLLDRLQVMRAHQAMPVDQDVTVFQAVRPATVGADDEMTRVVASSNVAAAAGPGDSSTGVSQLSSIGSWARMPVSNERHVSVGSTLKGRFLLDRELGRGGMGVVYLAQDARKVEARDRDPWVAVKVLSDEFRRHPDSLVALQREARRTQQLAHDNIVRVYDFDKDDGIVYMTMEYVAGCDLRTLIREKAPNGMPLDNARVLIEGMASALGRAHAAGIVHSDFKPGNVMVTPEGLPKVFDFGIARAGKHKGDAAGEQTVFDPSTLGALTPAYASLEMLRGHQPTPSDDIYALGCVCFELLTGKHPFDKLSAEVALKEGRRAPRLKGLTRRQNRTLRQAVAFEQNKRLPDVQALLEGLRDVSWRERTLPAVGIGTAAVLVLGAAGFAVWRQNESARMEKVIAGFSEAPAGRYRDEAQAQAGLASLSDDQRAQLVVTQNDLIQRFLLSRLDALWKPDAGRFNYAATAQVFGLRDRLRLYAPLLDSRRARLERERDIQLNILDTRLLQQLDSADVFQAGAGSVQETLERIGSIDPTSPLLQNPGLEAGYAKGIAASLQQGELEQARNQLRLAQAQFPQSLRLQLQDAGLRQQFEQPVVAALGGDLAAVGQRFDQLLATPSADAAWQQDMGAVLARLQQEPAGYAAAQARLSKAVAALLATRDQPAQLPDDLVLLDFALDRAPASAELLQQRDRLALRQQALLESLDAQRALADVQARSESFQRAVAAGDISKAESLLAQLQQSPLAGDFVSTQAPVLLERAYQARARAQLASSEYGASVEGLVAASAVLGNRPGLQQALSRHRTVAAVMAISAATPAAEREHVRQQLEARYRDDAAGMSALEREMQARGQLPLGTLRAQLQASGEPAQDRPTTAAVPGRAAAPKAAAAARAPAAVAAVPLPGANAEEEPLPPVPDGPDPCAGLAGKARTCFDPVGGARGPMLVVVPGLSGGPSFALSRGEIAVDDFNVYCQATGKCRVQALASAELGRLPVQNVSLAQARHYVRWLTRASGGWRYRIPTNAEWTHASHAGQQWQRSPDSNCVPPTAAADHRGGPAGVRGREANPWGLVNLAGNVWEWVSHGDAGLLRGGSYASFWSDCKVDAQRQGSSGGGADVGFRVLRELK